MIRRGALVLAGAAACLVLTPLHAYDSAAPSAASSVKTVGPSSLPDPAEEPAADDDTDERPAGSASRFETPTTSRYVKVSGNYRLAAGMTSESFILNDSNADLQERNYRYVFGERLHNTYDPAIYSRHLVNVDFTPTDKIGFFTQIVNDPWSWVGTTGEQVQRSDIGGEIIRYNLKYFGANNSTIPETIRTNVGDSVGIPVIKIHDGHLAAGTVAHGFFDFNPATGGIPFTIPELDINYEYRPIRKLWMDYKEDRWHARVFAFADQTQALTTDDPLELSNHKDYWQQSPWLYEYKPIQFFSDRSVLRGYYSDAISFFARDSDGNRLVLLKGASVEADLGQTYLAATVAAPHTPWEESYFEANNIPGAVRLKHYVNPRLMVGGTYTFRAGNVNDDLADLSQVGGVDVKVQLAEHVVFKGEIATSFHEKELAADERLQTSAEGHAYKAVVESDFDHAHDGHTQFRFAFTQMDQYFEPVLSRYTNTRDDHYWGNHLSFQPITPDMEYFRLGDGVDINRYVFHIRWREKLFKDRFENLFDIRNVHRSNDDAFKEMVLRDELTVQITDRLTAKGLFRWHHLPKSKEDIDPYIANYNFVGFTDPSNIVLKNFDVPADADPSRFTYSAGLQYIVNRQWTAEGFVEVSNDVPDFPRGLLNNSFRDANDRVDGILQDHVTNFLYGQGPLGGIPPYEYFTITRQRIIFQPEKRLRFIFHSAQNGYKYAGSIDDNINHTGLSIRYEHDPRLSLFFDYTRSYVIDLPKLIATGYTEHDYRGHDNLYFSADYRLSPSQTFRAEYGLFGLGLDSPLVTPYSTNTFSLPTIDTEHLLRVSLVGEF